MSLPYNNKVLTLPLFLNIGSISEKGLPA